MMTRKRKREREAMKERERERERDTDPLNRRSQISLLFGRGQQAGRFQPPPFPD
jgi:hypothetical protein